MKNIYTITAVLFFYGSIACAQEQEPKPGKRILLFGGQESCASWLSDPNSMNYRDGINWIFGYWSARNVYGEEVGAHTDGAGIIGEVKKYCQNAPSDVLSRATETTYEKLKKDGK